MRLSRAAAGASLALLLLVLAAAHAVRSARLAGLDDRLRISLGIAAPHRAPFSLVYDSPVLSFAGAPFRPATLVAHPAPLGDGFGLTATGGTLECPLSPDALEALLADPAEALRALARLVPPGVAAFSLRDATLALPFRGTVAVRLDGASGRSLSLLVRDGGTLRLELSPAGTTVDAAEFDLAPFLAPRIPRRDLAAALVTGRFEIERVAGAPVCAGEGIARLLFRGDGDAATEALVAFRLAGPRLELSPVHGTGTAIAGTADLARRTLSLTVDAERFDLGMIGRIFPDAGSIFAEYALRGFGGLHLALTGTEAVGLLTFENAVLAGDAGRANFVNLGGECAFSGDSIVLRDLRADYDRSPLAIRGRIDPRDGALDLAVAAEKVPFEKFRSLFAAMGLRIGDAFAGGLFDLDLRVGGSVRAPLVDGAGRVANGVMVFLDDLLEFRRVNGDFALRAGRVGLAGFDGFWGDIPFRGRGEPAGVADEDFALRIDFAHFTPDDIDSWIMASLSRMYFSRESSAGIRIASRGSRLDFGVRFHLKEVDINLYPVPGSVALDALAGSIEFHRDESGSVDLERGEFSFRGPSTLKLTLPQISVFPITVAGTLEGAVSFDDRTTGGIAFAGRAAMASAALVALDARYDARRVEVERLAVSFERRAGGLSFQASAGLLDGSFAVKGGARDAEGFALHADGRFDGISLDRFFAENPRATDFGTGRLAAEFRHRALDAASPFRATVTLRDGALRNLAVVNPLFGGELENRYYSLPYSSLQVQFESDGRILALEPVRVESPDPAAARILAKLSRSVRLVPEPERALSLAAWDAVGSVSVALLAQLSDRERPFAQLLRWKGFEPLPLKPLLHLGQLFPEDAGEQKKPAPSQKPRDRRKQPKNLR